MELSKLRNQLKIIKLISGRVKTQSSPSKYRANGYSLLGLDLVKQWATQVERLRVAITLEGWLLMFHLDMDAFLALCILGTCSPDQSPIAMLGYGVKDIDKLKDP